MVGVISDIATTRVSVPLREAFRTALRTVETAHAVRVAITTTDGATGYGEAVGTPPITGETLGSIEAAVAGPISAALCGRDVEDLDAAGQALSASVVGNFSAKSAVDCALYDLVARRLGVSLRAVLGGGGADVLTDITVSAADPGGMTDAARHRLAAGFHVLKLKVGGHGDVDRDVTRVKAVREGVGNDVTLRVDANQAWSPRGAVHAIRAFEDLGLEVSLVEQPVAAKDLDGLAFVTAHVDTPIMADESVFTGRDFLDVVKRRAADLVNVKLAKCGGLRAAQALLAIAETTGVSALIGCMLELPLAVAAATSLAAARLPDAVHDLDAAWWLADEEGPLRYEEGRVVLPVGAGLSAFAWP